MVPDAASFGAVRTAYVSHRPPYPEPLWARIEAALEGPRAEAIDLGAGSGLATAWLADRFAHVVAVEADPVMASWTGVPDHVELRVQRAEEAIAADRSVDLVTIASALHWMDADAVLRRAVRWLRPGGVLAAWRLELPTVHGALGDLLTAELADRWDAHRHPRLRKAGWTRAALRDLDGVETVADEELVVSRSLPLDALLGFLSTVSFVNGHARSTGDRDAYLADLGARCREVAGEGPVSLDMPYELAIVRSPRGA